MFPEQTLSRAAFELFSSSTANRYIRKARELASRTPLRDRLVTGEVPIEEVLERALILWRSVVRSEERTEEETELALVLASISGAADEQVDRFLRSLALSDRRNAAWLSSLARALYRARAENVLISLATPTGANIAARTTAASANVVVFRHYDAVAESANELLTV